MTELLYQAIYRNEGKLSVSILMTPSPNSNDELPYKSFPVEWTAPERLELASSLHGSRVKGIIRQCLISSVSFVPVSHWLPEVSRNVVPWHLNS